jgi:hypothetical protein
MPSDQILASDSDVLFILIFIKNFFENEYSSYIILVFRRRDLSRVYIYFNRQNFSHFIY